MRRRVYLKEVCAIGTASGLAGCFGLLGGDDGNGGNGDSDDESTPESTEGPDTDEPVPEDVKAATQSVEAAIDQYESETTAFSKLDVEGDAEPDASSLNEKITTASEDVEAISGSQSAAESLQSVIDYLDAASEALDQASVGGQDLVSSIGELVGKQAGDSDYETVTVLTENAVQKFDFAETQIETAADRRDEIDSAAISSKSFSKLSGVHDDFAEQITDFSWLATTLDLFKEGSKQHTAAKELRQEGQAAANQGDQNTADQKFEAARSTYADAQSNLDSAAGRLENRQSRVSFEFENQLKLLECRSKAYRDAAEAFKKSAKAFLDRKPPEEIQKYVDLGSCYIGRCETDRNVDCDAQVN